MQRKARFQQCNNFELNCNHTFEVAIPLDQDTAGLVSMESSELGVEIFLVEENLGVKSTQLLMTGSLSLPEVFDVSGNFVDAFMGDTASADPTVQLFEPFSPNYGKKGGEANVEISIKVDVGQAPGGVPRFVGDRVPVSPEFVGAGFLISLYSSHRGLWFDSKLGPGKFQSDHVANFVELNLHGLRFAKDDKDSMGKKYRIRASIGPCSTHTQYLTRPKQGWAEILGPTAGDTSLLKYNGTKLCLPLPPGCFNEDSPAARRKIHIQVFMLDVENEANKPMNYNDFIVSHTQHKPKIKETCVYQAHMSFENMLVDGVKTVTAYLGKKKASEVDVYTDLSKGDVTDACLNLEFALRDRDYIKAVVGQPSEKKCLCVGDKAMLMVEEPLTYPSTELEYRTRFFNGKWDRKHANDAAANRDHPDAWPDGYVELRQPCLSSEYALSGLVDVVPRVPFKQSFIPKFCGDVLPHKFVLPPTEKEFIERNLPGFFPKIVDDFVARKGDNKNKQSRRGPAMNVVERLTTFSHKIPVVVLAMYSDGTCDVEVGPEFISKWRKSAASQKRRFAIPGQLLRDRTKRPNQDGRFILQRVPQIYLKASYGACFNIYDALYKSTDDVLKGPAPQNGFDPRSSAGEVLDRNKQPFVLAAGPLPPDASSAACEYEWSVKLRAKDENEMHQLVGMLRRCVRLDSFAQAAKMIEYQKRTVAEVPMMNNSLINRPTSGGMLDVLLVEARRLKPPPEIFNLPEFKLNSDYLPTLAGTTSGEDSRSTPVGNTMVTTFVNFRMLLVTQNQDEPGKPKMETLVYKGQKLQTSHRISGTDSPSWASQDELQAKGGHLFHTGLQDPDRLREESQIFLDFEVMMSHALWPVPRKVSSACLSMTARDYLCNSSDPFKNLWLPLKGTDGKNKSVGELHLMFRWLTADQIPMGPAANQQQVSVKSTFMKSIWPRAVQQRLREPIYNLEVQHLRYNPNLVRNKDPNSTQLKLAEAPKDHQRRHAQELVNSVYYLYCVEERQTQAWQTFEDELAPEYSDARLAEIRLKWYAENQEDKLWKLHELVKDGIPSARRGKYWPELTLASRVMEREGVNGSRRQQQASHKSAEAEYEQLLAKGLPMQSDPMKQLQEDAFHLASWESQVPANPELMDLHLERVRRAQNVCAALISCEDNNVVYCESLLIVAFYMLLPQGNQEEKSKDDGTLHYFSECQVFWMLYTLIVSPCNGSYKEYYGTPTSGGGTAHNTMSPLASCAGAVSDVNLLECSLAYHEPACWQHLNAIGFQLSSVFFGCFMRLFATYMPTSSVLRLWDMLFAKSTDPNATPHARAHLIDLAFGVLKVKTKELLMCESAQEAKDLVLSVLSGMYDMGTVSDLIAMSSSYLWGGSGFVSSKIANMWRQREDMFQMANNTVARQNQVLQHLTHRQRLGLIPQTKYESLDGQAGVTTKELIKDVLPVMNNQLENSRVRKDQMSEGRRHWFMHRPLPIPSRLLCEDVFVQVWKSLGRGMEARKRRDKVPFLVKPLPSQHGEALMKSLEPLDVTDADFQQMMQRDVPNWAGSAAAIWQSFNNRQDKVHSGEYGTETWEKAADEDNISKFGIVCANFLGMGVEEPERPADTVERISLNELFISLIACSRGTLGEKAAALFNVYSTDDPTCNGGNIAHRTAVSKLAKSITRSSDVNSTAEKNVAPPEHDSDEAKRNALRLTVMSNYPDKNTRIGDVFIPTLAPYFQYAANEPETLHFNIWGKAGSYRRGNQGYGNQGQGYGDQGNQGYGNAGRSADDPRHFGSTNDPRNRDLLVCVGDIEMVITWTPKSIKDKEVGQLMIHIKGIWFYQKYMTDFYKLNPWVEVCTFKDGHQGRIEEEPIKRWDPRGLVGRDGQQSWLNTHGPYGGTMKFDQTMRADLIGAQGAHFSHFIRDGNQGFHQESKTWRWNDVWGKQYSVEDFRIDKQFVALSTRKNVMELAGARMITQTIFRRSMWNFSNRQALLLSDSIFNRSGAVPGILKAILVKSSNATCVHDTREHTCLLDLDTKYIEQRREREMKDVTNQIALEHERQVAENGGYVNLFLENYMQNTHQGLPRKINIKKDIGIVDPFDGHAKVLWIRYVRGGDGERRSKAIPVSATGDIVHEFEGVKSEVEMEQRDIWPQTRISKEEFVSCTLHNPLLGEAVRRLGATDHGRVTRRAISLDVNIMDPHKEEEDLEFLDAMNVQQSILLEVWDSDTLSKDFLGEVWLPPLSTFGRRSKDLVLPLKPADMSEEAENGPSREADKITTDNAKELAKKDPNKKISGELYVSVSWKYPAYEATPEELAKEGESLHDRALVQEKLHTGKLTIKIDRAKALRRADAKKGRDCDPIVQVWVRNDTLMRWREKPIARTKAVTNDRNPKWGFVKEDIPLLTGEYESKLSHLDEGFFQEVKNVFMTKRQKEKKQQGRDIEAVRRFGTDGLLVKFADNSKKTDARAARGAGENHGVDVFFGDSIFQFKKKLQQACESEAAYWKREKGESDANATAYSDVTITSKTLVMVFVPSAKVQRLFAQGMHEGKEYKEAYDQALIDPSSWQPLDTARSFSQYPQFGFGRGQAQQLRVVEATESYKLNNLRYKEFDRDMNKKGYEDTDTTTEAFGWARYAHKFDSRGSASTTEWRPCIASAPPKGKNATDSYGVRWVFPISSSEPAIASAAVAKEEVRETHEKQFVLLKSRCPQFDNSVHHSHVELLEQARILRTSGKNDFDIAQMLDKLHLEQWTAEKHQDEKRVPITVDVVKAYLQRSEMEASLAKPAK
jgi:hypothetical protein